MWKCIRKGIGKIFPEKGFKVHLENIRDSKIGIKYIKELTILSRPKFKVSQKWFNGLLTKYYDDEIKSKYIPSLHQSNLLEKGSCKDIFHFSDWRNMHRKAILDNLRNLQRFEKSYTDFYQLIESESILVKDENSPFISSPKNLHLNNEKLNQYLTNLETIFNKGEYEMLTEIPMLSSIDHGIAHSLKFKSKNWIEFLEKDPAPFDHIRYMFEYHDQVYSNLNELNKRLENIKFHGKHKIIAGNAGTGKTHTSAHLVTKIKENNDLVIFLKPKLFNGDNVNFDERLLQLLHVPKGYTLPEALVTINKFAKSNHQRCFIIIDALNETTKANIGFSDIWKTYLDSFINQISLHSHLYVICTLRTSYILQIWNAKPGNIVELNGFDKKMNLPSLCDKYFAYYKINITNLHEADLSYFRIPLLLDLFCKLTNGKRESTLSLTLNVNTYVQVFEDYIKELIREVKTKVSLQKDKLIVNGFKQCAHLFFANNAATLSTDDFYDAFDKDDFVSPDQSIARYVLEGYLIFIKDVIDRNNEIVKHTQQEVGGYLLAKELSACFADIQGLVTDAVFIEKIIGTDTSKHHQLRLDILKFLIALRPELIRHLTDQDGVRLSWWYLFNGYASRPDAGIISYLKELPASTTIIRDITNYSGNHWWNRDGITPNFTFVSEILNKLDLWQFETDWTFYIYEDVEFFSTFIEDNIRTIKKEEDPDYEYYFLAAKLISYVLATNIRDLRDLATIFLIEYGRRYPLDLLTFTQEASQIKDSYIYERLVSCCYGVALICQNDQKYLTKSLPQIARALFDLQFADNPIASVYNYIVIDSIKHLLDLAVMKEAISFTEPELQRILNYEFTPPFEWIPPTQEQVQLINESTETNWPDPIGMDFGIYTIPRLLIDEHAEQRNAIANVYGRIINLDYRNLVLDDHYSAAFKAFYWGNKAVGFSGKVDRLGKKYAWKAFFDYAGYLLLTKTLNVFDKYDAATVYYQRLGDVDIDISLPNKNFHLPLQLYHDNLLVDIDKDTQWYEKNKIDTLLPLLYQEIEGNQYTLLHGVFEQRLNEDFKVRSTLFAETFFVKNDDRVTQLKEELKDQLFDWSLEVHLLTDHLSNVYFGELYWADTMPAYVEREIGIPSGKTITIKRKLNWRDVIEHAEYKKEDIGREMEEVHPERVYFESESTLVEYMWESDSTELPGFTEYFPSIKIGKSLQLQADCRSGQILDKGLKTAVRSIQFTNEQHFRNTATYFRTDLLKQYMAENNLLLVHQIKQHSYDEKNMHFRKLAFFIDA